MADETNVTTSTPSPKKKSWFARHKILTAIIAIIVIAAAVSSGNKNNTTDNSSQKTTSQNSSNSSNNSNTKPTTNEPKSYAAGTYKVGTDLPAGEYRLIATSGAGYMQISSDSTASFDSIIANDNFTTQTIVAVEAGQYFKLDRAKAYAIDSAPAIDTTKEGTFKVGKDIPAGEYKVRSTDSGYLQVSSDSTHKTSSIVSNDNFDGDTYITVSDGQYLTLNRAHIVK